MKKLIIAGALMGLMVLPLAGCRMGAPDVQVGDGISVNPALTPSQVELMHHNFNLTSVNGQPVMAGERQPHIEFNQGFRVSGQVCNNFSGFGELTDNVLVVKEMVSTKMLCLDQNLNNMESLVTSMLQDGVIVQKDTTTLTLSRGEDVLVFTLRDWV